MILVFDIGTTAVKGALFSLDGRLIKKASLPVGLSESDNPLIHEADPEEWINVMKKLVPNLLSDSRKDPRAIVVSGNGPTLVPTGGDGKPLYPAMTWMDRRGIEEAKIIKERSGEYVDPTFFLPKVLWIKRNKPEIFEKTCFFFSCPEYITYFLTGEAVMVFPGEGLEKFIWTDELITLLDMDKEKFPPFVDFGHPAGNVTKRAAKTMGIKSGVPVFAGGPDFVMSLLGTATVVPGRGCDRAGTSEGINICSQKKVDDSRLLCYRHIVREYWNVTGIISTSGKALDWFKNIFFGKEISFEQLFQKASQARAGSGKLLFLPYLTGERAPIWDPHARGVFTGLALHHGVEEMARAVIESTGFAIRDVLSVMEENDIFVDELRITGNPSKSGLWNQIKADITGKNILVPEIGESELVGDLCVALYGLGEFSSLGEASEENVKIEKVFKPEIDNKSLYDNLFSMYRETYKHMRYIFSEMAGIEDKEKK
jgi:xylulokinase